MQRFTIDLTPEFASLIINATATDPDFAARSRWTRAMPAAPTTPAMYARKIARELDLGVSPVCDASPVLLTSMRLEPLEHNPRYHDDPAEAIAALRGSMPPAELRACLRVVFGLNLLRGLVQLGRPAPVSIGFLWPQPPRRQAPASCVAVPIDDLQNILDVRLEPRRFTEWLVLRTILTNRARWPAGVPSDFQTLPSTYPDRLTAPMLTSARLPDAELQAACDAAEGATHLCAMVNARWQLATRPSWFAWPLFATAGRMRPIRPWFAALAAGDAVSPDGLPISSLLRYLTSFAPSNKQPHTEIVRRIVNEWTELLQQQSEYPQEFARAAIIDNFNSTLDKK